MATKEDYAIIGRVANLCVEILGPCNVAVDYLNGRDIVSESFGLKSNDLVFRFKIESDIRKSFCVHSREELSDDDIRERIRVANRGESATLNVTRSMVLGSEAALA